MRATYNFYFNRRFRLENNYLDEIKRKQGIANEALDLAEEGKSTAEICKHLKISAETLSRIKKDVSSYEEMLEFQKTISLNANEKSSVNNDKKEKTLTKEEFINSMLSHKKSAF